MNLDQLAWGCGLFGEMAGDDSASDAFQAATPAARIPVRSPEDVWTFTQRNVPLWDILEFFPPDAIGPRGPKDAPRPYEVRPIVVETDLGFSFESDAPDFGRSGSHRDPHSPSSRAAVG